MSNSMGRRNIGAMQNRDNIPKDDVKKALSFSMAVAPLNTGRVQSPEELEERFKQLFVIADKMGMLPRYEHLALVSGLPTRTLFDYGNENNPSGPSQRFSPTIKKAKLVIASAEAYLAATGKMPSAVYIFRSKNYEGLKDVQEIKATNDFSTNPTNPEEVVQSLPDVNENDFIEIEKK